MASRKKSGTSHTAEEIEKLREIMEFKHARMGSLRVAYLHRTAFEGRIPEFEHLMEAARDFVQANYAYQQALFGKIRIKLSPAKLLR
jgi:hypothetical protein